MTLLTLLAEADNGSLIIKGNGTSGDITIKSPLRSEITDISSLINVFMSFLFPLALIIIFLMFVYAGYLYLSSEGSPDKVKQAQGVITSSIVGFILLFVAFFVVRLVASFFGFQGGILPK